MEDNGLEDIAVSQGKALSPEEAAQIAAHLASARNWWVVTLDEHQHPTTVAHYAQLMNAIEAAKGVNAIVISHSQSLDGSQIDTGTISGIL